MSVQKTIREAMKSTLLLKKRARALKSPWQPRNVLLITENSGNLPRETSRLSITNPKNQKTTTIDISNIMSVEPSVESRVIMIVLPNNHELKFKAEDDLLFMSWVAELKVAIGKGTIIHVKHRRRDAIADVDSLLHFIDVANEATGISDQVLVLSSPLDDITRHAWKVSQIRQFRITDLGICIEFCPNCYKTHTPQFKSFNLFVTSSEINRCVEFICSKANARAVSESSNNFISIYKIRDHFCVSPSPPVTPPPAVPVRGQNNNPPMPPRVHPRFGHLNGPPAEPFLPGYEKMNPAASHHQVVSPYKITSKIVINNDGTVCHESTILGHLGRKGDSSAMTPHRKAKAQCPLKKRITSRHRVLESCNSYVLVPPRNVERHTRKVLVALRDDDDNPDEDYENSWPSSPFPPVSQDTDSRKPLSYIEPINSQEAVEEMCNDYVNIPEMLKSFRGTDETDHTNADGLLECAPSIGVNNLSGSSPCMPEVDNTESISEPDDFEGNCKDYVNIPDILQHTISGNNTNIPRSSLCIPPSKSPTPESDNDSIDRDYINVQEILNEITLPQKAMSCDTSTPKPSTIRPVIKKRTVKPLNGNSKLTVSFSRPIQTPEARAVPDIVEKSAASIHASTKTTPVTQSRSASKSVKKLSKAFDSTIVAVKADTISSSRPSISNPTSKQSKCSKTLPQVSARPVNRTRNATILQQQNTAPNEPSTKEVSVTNATTQKAIWLKTVATIKAPPRNTTILQQQNTAPIEPSTKEVSLTNTTTQKAARLNTVATIKLPPKLPERSTSLSACDCDELAAGGDHSTLVAANLSPTMQDVLSSTVAPSGQQLVGQMANQSQRKKKAPVPKPKPNTKEGNTGTSVRIHQDVPSRSNPITIDQSLVQSSFSTFGVSSAPATCFQYRNRSCSPQQPSDLLQSDGLEESHSTFTTFGAPANKIL